MKLSREVKTAIIAILILAISIWGFSFLKGKNIIKPSDEYHVVYDNIEGVIASGAVYYRGYKVGNIQSIDFDYDNPNQFVVTFVLENRLKIPVGSKVIPVQSNPIVSARDLEIVFSDSTIYYSPGDTLMPGYDPGIMGILEPLQNQFDHTITHLNATLAALNQTLDEETQKNIRESIASLKNTLKNLSNELAPNGSLGKSFANIESVTNTVKSKNQALAESIDHFSNISAQLDSANLKQTIEKLDSVLYSANMLISKINNNEGTMGLLVNDSVLYQNLTKTTASLNTLLSDLKANPRRYVHFSMFGNKDKTE